MQQVVEQRVQVRVQLEPGQLQQVLSRARVRRVQLLGQVLQPQPANVREYPDRKENTSN